MKGRRTAWKPNMTVNSTYSDRSLTVLGQFYRHCKHWDRLNPILNKREGGTANLRTDSTSNGFDVTSRALAQSRIIEEEDIVPRNPSTSPVPPPTALEDMQETQGSEGQAGDEPDGVEDTPRAPTAATLSQTPSLRRSEACK